MLAAVVGLLLFCVSCGGAIRLARPSQIALGFYGGDGRSIAVVTPFLDNREKPACKRGPEDLDAEKRVYSSEHDRLGCSPLPPEWIAGRIAQGLAAAGFSVLTEAQRDALSSDERIGIAVITGRLDRLEVESMSKMQTVMVETDLQLEISVSRPDGLRASRPLHFRSHESVLWVDSELEQRVFDETAERSVSEITAAILSLLNRYPMTVGDVAPGRGAE